MKRAFKAGIAALGLAVALVGAAAAGQFEDGAAALMRGDYPTAVRLLGPLAEQGDARAQAALAGLPGSKYASPPPPITPSPLPLIMPVIVITAGFAAMAIALGIHKRQLRARQARATKVAAEYFKNLPPEVRAEMDRARRVAAERPWEPITFGLDSVEMMENGFRFRAAAVHRGRAFGFAIGFTMAYGPVAVCEWSREGTASEALLDILANYADVPRGESRFDDFFKTSAIILSAEPSNVPFAQLRQLTSKVFFEQAEDNPEIYLKLDFESKTGTIDEKDPLYRRSLVHAFHA